MTAGQEGRGGSRWGKKIFFLAPRARRCFRKKREKNKTSMYRLIWNIEQERGREKEKVGNRPAKLNEERSDRELQGEKKPKLLEEQHENFVVAVRK